MNKAIGLKCHLNREGWVFVMRVIEERTNLLKAYVEQLGADLVGFADLSNVDRVKDTPMVYGISIAKRIHPQIAETLKNGPSKAYSDEYERLNTALNQIGEQVVTWIESEGFDAIARTTQYVKWDYETRQSDLPHKTVATRAGLGWIGKCALLVNDTYGSAIRLTTVITDMPLMVGTAIDESKCGQCEGCRQACPAGAVKGVNWSVDKERDAYYDSYKCMNEATRVCEPLGIIHKICGRCIIACPYTLGGLKHEYKD